MILIPDKGQGVVLINKKDYYQSLERFFDERKKYMFQITIQLYIHTMCKRGEINDTEMTEMRPKAAKVGRANGLPKIHRNYTDLPSFQPIIDTTNTLHYGVGKTHLLKPLTQNVYSVKDLFEAVDRIRLISTELFDEGYRCFFMQLCYLQTFLFKQNY